MAEIKKYGYIRKSSESQESNNSIEYQKQKLLQNGIKEKNIRIEITSGTNEIKNRPVFKKLLEEKLKPKDLLVITKIDICSRNTLDFLNLQTILFKKGINLISLDFPISSYLTNDESIIKTLSTIVEFDNDKRRERQRKGIIKAQQAGKYKGRKSIITPSLIKEIQNLKENKDLSITKISEIIGVSRPTIYKVLKNELGYISNRLDKRRKINKAK